VVFVSADYITISGFMIQNGGLEFPNGGIHTRSNNCTIFGNNIENNFYGIVMFFSDHIDIINNDIIDNNQCGIYLEGSSNNNILGNFINNQPYNGVGLWNSSNNNIISENTIINNNYSGIRMLETFGNIISKNMISKNLVGARIEFSSNTTISCNNFIKNRFREALFVKNDYYQNKNTWDGNYWNRFRLLPYLILGKTNSKLRVETDWHPSKIPNEIVSNPFAIIETNMGTMKLELYKDKVPTTVENFIKLANDGFYDDLVFHRVIDDFVIQGGGYYANGTYKTSPYGSIELEIHPDVRHVDGAISMARTSDPNSATSQFFICDGKQSFLDDNYAAFGKIIVGIDVLRDAASVVTTTKYRMQDWPVDDVIIESVTILNQ
ncbi:MAG: peptidylprolyl isomerase, partial [Thermoplasmatales archaeon]|nr:peptidylprolyl isomerase [Thermoplasmatales archaeon]